MIYKAAIIFVLIVIAYFTWPVKNDAKTAPTGLPFKDLLGVNAFEWNFLENPNKPGDHLSIYEPKMKLIQSFGGVRHYLDWQKIEPEKGKFTFNPTADGGWNLDTIYQRCKGAGLEVLVCLKTCPNWLLKTYPSDGRDAENVPIPFGSNKSDPASYLEQAKAAFQFAARYGHNKKISRTSIAVNTLPRWANDKANQIVIGSGLVRYIECDNERDKWWKGQKAHQTAEEYAANLSAFYDGDKGRLGKGIGVKQADPGMLVVMAGLASADVNYVKGIINWCKKHRGYKVDGTVNLCFDIINYHLYANDHSRQKGDQRTVGVAPELCEADAVAEQFSNLGKQYHLAVWVTEAGYDINSKSPQRAVSVGSKSAFVTQGDWIIRTALLYARHGIQKLFFYELYDDQPANPGQYESCGLVNNDLTRRPAANYISQIKDLMGEFYYQKTINRVPTVDQYRSKNKIIYVLTMPSQRGASMTYNLPLKALQVFIYQLDPFSLVMKKQVVVIHNNSLNLTVSETPLFVELTD